MERSIKAGGWLAIVLLATAFTRADDRRNEGDFAALMAEQQAASHVQAWQRYPFIGIPLSDRPPTVDGVVDVREWSVAAHLSHLLHAVDATMVDHPTSLWLFYTEDHLHIAFQFARPAAAGAPGPKDLFELIFDVGHHHGRYHNLGLALGGEAWSGIGPNLDKAAWTPGYDFKARVTDVGWEGELSIPFSEFPAVTGTPTPGTIWGVDLVRNECTPTDRIAHLAWRGRWHASKDFAHLMFTGVPMAIQVDAIGWMPKHKKMGMKLTAVNFDKSPGELQARLTLRKAAADIPMGFLPALDSAFTEDLDAAIGADMGKEIAQALGAFPIVEEKDTTVAVPANTATQIALVMPDEPGQYLAGFTLRREGTLASAMYVPFTVRVPLEITLRSYLYSANTLTYDLDLRRIADDLTPGAVIETEVRIGEDGPPLASRRHEALLGVNSIGGEFTLAPQPGATYFVRARVTDDEGEVAVSEQPLMLPEKPAWIGNQIGRSKFVPPPWVPLEADSHHTETLTIGYDWTGDLFPGIRVKGKEILAAPIALTFKDGAGNDARLKPTRFLLRTADDERAEYAFVGEIDHVGRLEGTITVEFDGFLWYDLTLTPTSRATLSQCLLTASLKNEYAKIFTRGRVPTGTEYLIPEGPEVGVVPEDPLVSPFTFQTWIGYLEGGLQWYGENNRNWHNADPKHVIRVEKGPKATTLAISLVDTRISLDRPIDWHFGLMPTPARTQRGGAENHAYFQCVGTPAVELDPTLQARDPKASQSQQKAIRTLHGLGEKGVRAVILFNQYNDMFGYPGIRDPGKQQRLRSLVPFMHDQGVKVLVYNGWGITTDCPEWATWNTELVNLPLKNAGYTCYWNSPVSLYPDLFLHRLAEHMREYDLDGIYMDSTTGINYSVHPNGMRWIDDAGRPRGSFPVLAMRDFTKRIYKVLHGEVIQDGLFYNHHSPQANVCVENFTDVRCPSEFAQFYEGTLDQEFIDYFVAKNGGIQYGYHAELTNKNWMKSLTLPLNELNAVAVPLGVSFKAVTLENYIKQDYSRMAQPMPKLWGAFAWLDSDRAEHLPWWKDDAYVATLPTEGVLTAVWMRKGEKALLCVSNLPREARTIEVNVDLAALGMPTAVAEDAIVGGSVPLADGRLTLDIEGQRWRLIKLAPPQ